MTVKLEQFREEDIGNSFFHHADTNTFVQNTYHQRCQQAFYLSLQCLEELENSKYAFPPGQFSTIAVGSWFICIESLINNILKVATESNLGTDFNSLKSKDLSTRLRELIKVVDIDPSEFGKAKLFAQIQEFCEFRNEMFHDRTFEKKMHFHNTMFSDSVVAINQVDIIQAFQIFLKLSMVLRYSICGLDLMPNILINRNNKVFYSKIDALYKNLIIDAFTEVLKKHNLSSDLAINSPLAPEPWCRSPIPVGWSTIIKYQKKIALGEANLEYTDILSSKMDEIVNTEAKHLNDEQFRVPDYLDKR